MDRIVKWKVENRKVTLSDHNYITFGVTDKKGKMTSKERRGNRYPRWKIKEMDQELFEETIEWKCETYKNMEEIVEEENGAIWLQKIVTEAADTSTPRSKEAPNERKVHWWSGELTQTRRECIRSRRNWTKAKKRSKKGKAKVEIAELKRLEEEYRKRKKELTKGILKAKEDSWKELLREIEKDPWGIPYRLVMDKLRQASIGMTEMLEEDIVEKLIYKLFPRETEEEKEESERERKIAIGEWKEEWDVDIAEVYRALKKKKVSNTAPGPDGIVQKMWRRVPGKMLRIISEIRDT